MMFNSEKKDVRNNSIQQVISIEQLLSSDFTGRIDEWTYYVDGRKVSKEVYEKYIAENWGEFDAESFR